MGIKTNGIKNRNNKHILPQHQKIFSICVNEPNTRNGAIMGSKRVTSEFLYRKCPLFMPTIEYHHTWTFKPCRASYGAPVVAHPGRCCAVSRTDQRHLIQAPRQHLRTSVPSAMTKQKWDEHNLNLVTFSANWAVWTAKASITPLTKFE